MTFKSTSTASIPPFMPPTGSPLASTPHTNGLLPTTLNLTPPKPKLSLSTYPYVPPPSLNHPHLSKHDHPPHSKHFRNLGLHIDSTISLDTHIALMHKSIHYHFPIAVTIASPIYSPYSTIATTYYSISPPTNLLNCNVLKMI